MGGKPINPDHRDSKFGGPLTSDDTIKMHAGRVKQNAAFCERVRWAIRQKLENPYIGVNHNPSTERPLYVGLRALPFSPNQSPAALCMAQASVTQAEGDRMTS